jgi:hypothetical protein
MNRAEETIEDLSRELLVMGVSIVWCRIKMRVTKIDGNKQRVSWIQWWVKRGELKNYIEVLAVVCLLNRVNGVVLNNTKENVLRALSLIFSCRSKGTCWGSRVWRRSSRSRRSCWVYYRKRENFSNNLWIWRKRMNWRGWRLSWQR